MEHLIPISATWWNLIFLALILTGIYLGLGFLGRLLGTSNLFRYVRDPMREILRVTRILFEPVAAFLLAFIFVLINHLEHGALIILIVIISFPHLRNYVSGRIMMMENVLQPGDQIRVGDIQGKVQILGRLGIKLRNQQGLVHLSYQKIFQLGYSRIFSAGSGEYITLRISPIKEKPENNLAEKLATVLAVAPYVDWHVKPAIKAEADHNFQARVLLKKEAHLGDLVELLKEKGFQTQALNGHFDH